MNTLIAFFGSIITLFSGLLGHTPTLTIQQPATSIVAKAPASQFSTSDESSTWKLYQNEKYRFKLKYPSVVTAKEIKMQDSSNIVFYLELKHTGASFDSTANVLIKKNGENKELKKYILDTYSNQCASSQTSPEGEPCLTLPELIGVQFNNVQGFREKFSETQYGDYYFMSKKII